MKAKVEKWKVRRAFGDPARYVVDGAGTLVADCYADSAETVGLPDQKQARRNARRIAMLPEIVAQLRRIGAAVPSGCRAHREIRALLERYDKLTPKPDGP